MVVGAAGVKPQILDWIKALIARIAMIEVYRIV
jgi:hypothetical protein